MIFKCDYCGQNFISYPKKAKHRFCSRQCLAYYSSKTKNPDHYRELKNYENIGSHLSDLNRRLNPLRMNEKTRYKLRQIHLGKGAGKGYAKLYGVHEHRIVAEIKLGRKLKPNEVVHHIDGNKRNNDPDNLQIFASQADHAAWHSKLRKGGEAK